MTTMGPLGGAARDPGAPTIDTKNVDGKPPGPHGGGLHPESESCAVNQHGNDRKIVILLTCPILPTVSPVMAYDP
jgi:hypothetical protein